MKLFSWNVNGIRAAIRHGFLDWLDSSDADIVCVQETKAHAKDVPQLATGWGEYKTYWHSAEKKGYSGVALLSRVEPLTVTDMNAPEFDSEGRVIVAEYKKFTLIGAYFPNSQEAGKRLSYKLEFCDRMLEMCNALCAKGKNIVLCGDYNIAHKEIDLTHPKQNEGNPGFLPEERAWMDKFTASGYTDTFRVFNQEPENYTWWSYRARAREKNVGWRIDYHCVNDKFKTAVKNADIHADVMGSDHCPVSIELKV